GWSWHQQSKQNQNTSAKHAKTQLLHEAGSKLAPQDSAALGPIVKQIEQQPDFDTDADYLYVLTTYYLNVNETDKAGDYLAKLKTAYDPAKGFDASIKPVSDWMTIEQLQSKLQAVKSPKKPTNPAGFGG
ncbi:MAG TPA: hypothetical protein VFL85_03415, partial [Candidatus Saccharimonadales bacterium]|nr:hypothetical protein [Candidatus Saccharimonadales bacterium]